MDLEADIRKALFGLIDIMLNLIDNVWMRLHHIKIQSGGHTDENNITASNFKLYARHIPRIAIPNQNAFSQFVNISSVRSFI